MKRLSALALAIALAPAAQAQQLNLATGSSSVAGPHSLQLKDITYDAQRYTVTLFLNLDGTWSLNDRPGPSSLDLTSGSSQITGADTVQLNRLTYAGALYDAGIRFNLNGTWSALSVSPVSSGGGSSSHLTQGLATQTTANLLAGCPGSRVSAVGSITSSDGSSFVVPAETAFQTGTKASDLYNDCTGFRPGGISGVDVSQVPIKEIDAGGDVVTGYIFADNYFELYVNGTLVGVDPVPYTPFNSNVVRFRAKKPYTYAIKLVDWEENLGVGTENNNGNPYHAGDGGFIAVFSDGTATDATWKAQTFYIAPLTSPNEVQDLADGTHSTASASDQPSCAASCYAMHYDVPADWAARNFDDSGWPAAVVYSQQTVGVDNKPAFTNFAAQFAPGQFVWSSNLVLDNLVLLRKTVQ